MVTHLTCGIHSSMLLPWHAMKALSQQNNLPQVLLQSCLLQHDDASKYHKAVCCLVGSMEGTPGRVSTSSQH